MKQSRFTEERIIAILREHEAGSKTGDVCRKLTHASRLPFDHRLQDAHCAAGVGRLK